MTPAGPETCPACGRPWFGLGACRHASALTCWPDVAAKLRADVERLARERDEARWQHTLAAAEADRCVEDEGHALAALGEIRATVGAVDGEDTGSAVRRVVRREHETATAYADLAAESTRTCAALGKSDGESMSEAAARVVGERDAARRDLAAERGRVVAMLDDRASRARSAPRTDLGDYLADALDELCDAIEAGEHEGGET